jgi:hypothetical protein
MRLANEYPQMRCRQLGLLTQHRHRFLNVEAHYQQHCVLVPERRAEVMRAQALSNLRWLLNI